MTRRSIKILLWVAVPILLTIAAWTAFGPGEIRLTESRLQSIVDEQLPKTQSDVTVERGTVRLQDDQVFVELWMNGSKFGQTFDLQITTLGRPAYDPSNGSFYFRPTDVTIEDVTVERNGVSVGNQLKGLVDRYLPDNKGASNLAEDLAPAVQAWLEEAAERGATFALQRMPIYTLPDNATGIAAMMFLNDVWSENGELVIDFTLWRLTWWIFLIIVAIAGTVGMLVAMARSPGLFAGATIVGSFGE